MKQKKFEQLQVVVEIFDECDSLICQLQRFELQGKKFKKLRVDMVKTIQTDLARLKDEVFKL